MRFVPRGPVTRRAAAGAAAVGILLGGAACSSPGGSTGSSGSSGSSTINGAGSAFAAPMYQQWAGQYKSKHGVQINYQAIGSGGGISEFTQGVVNFGATDAPMTGTEQAAAQAGQGSVILHIPMIIGSVAICCNEPGIKSLKLDGPTLASIYLGKITKWNAPAIKALNPGVVLPPDSIQPVRAGRLVRHYLRLHVLPVRDLARLGRPGRRQQGAELPDRDRGHGQLGHGGRHPAVMLDEIGDMPMRLQVKLLRVLQESVIRPVGSTDALPVNVRVISATHRDLQLLMTQGQFREDLYYRLNVVHIEMPPLNRRREDIPLLVAHFLAQIAKETAQRKIYAPEAVGLLATADWPGNIRQLQNVVRQNVALSQTPIIPVELVQQSLGGSPGRLPSFDEARDEFTRSYLSQILQITGGNVSQAARLAKRNRTDFYKLLARHQLTPEEFKQR